MSQSPDSSDSSGVAAAFDLLAPGLQRQLWRMGWRELRPLQVRGIRALLETRQHVILAAPTASGKTEAAFLPILSQIVAEPLGSVRALYVGPLKALINDQFARVQDLCGYLEMPVYHWHGDVGAAAKAKLLETPGGVLLITPESIESLIVNKPAYLGKMFAGLRFIVIDELHAFLETARGLHLRSLLTRLRPYVSAPERLRLVGLSATLGDMAASRAYLDRAEPERVQVIEDSSEGKELKLRIHAYEAAEAPGADPAPDEEESVPEELRRLAADLVRHCHGAANLVFANARSRVEELADCCQEVGRQEQYADRFLVHHGALSAEIRQDTEQTMKSGALATTFCSSTLEMGIDIGSVRMVCQVGAPWSVASLKQRLGRSGRKAQEPQILRMYVTSDAVTAESDLFQRLHLELLQAVAMTELLLEGWVEPPVAPTWDLSTLTHQILSVIGQTGGLRADQLFARLVRQGVFSEIDAAVFAQLLRQLASKKVLEQMVEGDLILGLTGEALLRHKGFYAVFQTPDEYAVVHQETKLGTLEIVPEPGQHLILAAKRWRVEAVDAERRVIHVQPARGKQRTRFGGSGGLIHPQICQKMKEVLQGSQPCVYLDTTGQKMLAAARQTAREAGVCTAPLLKLGPRRCALMTWSGTRIQHTLLGLLRQFGVQGHDETIGLVLECSPDDVPTLVQRCLAGPVDEPALAEAIGLLVPERKYDWLLGVQLRRLSIQRGYVDMAAARAALRSLNLPQSAAQEGPVHRPARAGDPILVALDFETANGQPDSACAIGLVKIVGGQIVAHEGHLIRPPSRVFSPMNVRVHGLTWDRVAGAPSFGEFWPKLQAFWQDADYLVAHNAAFDRGVLEACCGRYGLPVPAQEFLCTLEIARKVWPDLPAHRLDCVCEHLQIPLRHHEAAADALACARILLAAVARGHLWQ